MKIRTFREGDRKAVIDLWEICGLTRAWNDPQKDVDRKISFQLELFLVGELDDKVIASAMAGYDGHRGSVFYLAVDPDFQSKGYGKKIMGEVEAKLQSLGCPKINIVIRTSNREVQKFYRNLGYSTDEVVSVGKRLISDA